MATAAAAIVLVGALGAGVAIGRGTAPVNSAGPGPTPSAPSVSPLPSGTRVGTTVDPQTGTRLTATVIPAQGWVKVNASVAGIPVGENCRLIVVGKNNPNGEIALGWIVAGPSVNLDGAAAVAPEDVTAIKVVNTKGETFVTLKL
jgi:RNA polymerase sigma-70 factor (ECF subfamily)